MNNQFGSTQGTQVAHSVNQVALSQFMLPKRAASTVSNHSLVSGDTASFLLEGGKSQSSKRQVTSTTHGVSHQSAAESRQTAGHSSALVAAQGAANGSAAAQYIAAELVAANNSLNKSGGGGARNATMANQHRNSKNRKLYTSIGAYNNRADDQYVVGISGGKQGFMATAGPPGSQPGGFSLGGQSGVIPQGQQSVGQGSIQAALARKMQHAQVHQQRNIVLSQQQSLANKVALLPESEEDLRRLQVQQLLSHQTSVNQSNQSQQQQMTGMVTNSEARTGKGARDRVANKKSANSSVLVVPSRDLQSDIAKNVRKQQAEPNTAMIHHSAATQMDSSQISMISRVAHEGFAKDSIGAAQLAAYNSQGVNADTSLPHTSFHDTSVLSGQADSNNANQGYNTALIVKQRGLNNMSQIVATSNQLTSAHNQAMQKYKNANVLQGFNSQQPAGKERVNYHGQAAHNSVIIEKNSSSDQGVKQVKRNTLVKITNTNVKPNNFTQVGNYIDSQSKEYLENSFHEVKSVSRAHANQSEIQRTQPGHLGHGKANKSKLQTIGSSNKVNKHATVGASDSLVAQQLSQNQVNFISNFHIEDQEQLNDQKKQQPVPNTQSTSKSGNLAKNQQNYILLQTQNNANLTQKQRPHSSFKAQTQKPINSFKQHLVNLSGQPNQQTSGVGNQQVDVLSGKALMQNVVTAQAHTSGRKATNQSQQQQLLIGADGVVGIGAIGSAGSLAQTKGVASRKSKHLAQPIKQAGGGKNLLIGKTQKLNQMSVYQNQMVGEINHREPRRIGRGGSGIDTSGLGVRNELSNITKDHREMRTSSAAAGNTNTEFKLMNLTGTVTQGHSGNALNNGAAGMFNLNNHNQNYQIGGPGPADASASHVLSGISAISGHSGGGTSAQTAILTVPSNKNGPQATHAIFNATAGSQKASSTSKAANGKNKSSKRNIAAAGAGSNSGVPSFPIENLLSSTNKSLINASNTEQMVLLQNIDSIRSGDGGLATRGSVLGGGGVNGLMGTASKNPAGYGINMHPAKLYDQDSRQNYNKSTNGGGVRASSKASKASVRQSILSGNGAPAKQSDGANMNVQANRAHQQSMQKFLQQQMTMYNIQQNPSRGGAFNNQAPKNAKRAQGLAGINSGTASKQVTSKQRDGQIMNYYNSNLQNFQYASTSSQIQAQGHQGQCLSQGQAQPQGQGSGGGKGLKSSAQKLTKKQIHHQNQLASDRLRGSQQQRDNKDAFRKGGTQTAIGTGFGQMKILNSNPLQVQRQSSQKNQSHSLSRSRVTSQNRQQQVLSNNMQMPGSGASSAQGNKKAIKALSSVPGQTPTIGTLGSLSATPGIHLSHLMRQMNADGSNSAAMAAHQRTNLSQMQQSNISANPRLDMYRQPATNTSGRAQTVSGVPTDALMLPGSALMAAHHLATSLSSGAGGNKGPDSNRQFGPNAAVSEFDILELTQQQLRQIQTAESAVNEMRVALNQHKATDVVMVTAGEASGKGDKAHGQYSQQRPRSQNDMHSNFVPIDGVDSDGLAEMMAFVPSREVEMQGDIPPDAMSYQSKHRDGNSGAFRAVENNQSRLWSQERLQKTREDEATAGLTGSLEFINHGLSDTQGINSTFIEKNESKQVGQADDEIDKEQFLIIVSNAFEKIMNSMHPVLGNNLKHIKNMYTHFIEQVEQNHHLQLQENAHRIQTLEQTVADLQAQNQQLNLQMNQKQNLHDEKKIQLTALATKNKELMVQNQKTVEESRLLKANFNKLKGNYEKQKREIENFKSNKVPEGMRIQQEQNDRGGRDEVGRAIIQEMKQNFASGNNNKRDQYQETEIERLKRMELNGRTKEVPNSNIVFQDEAESIVEGIPDFTAAELQNDPLDLNGDIGRIGKLNFARNHVRITQGDIVEENQRIQTDTEGIERDQDTGRVADRYARDRNASRLGHRGKMSRRGLNGDLTEDEVADAELSSIPSYDMSKMHTDQPRAQNQMIEDLSFDKRIEDEINENSVIRNGVEGDSEFSSRIHSSSETFSSEMIMAYQQAIRMNQGVPPLPNEGHSSRKEIAIDSKTKKERHQVPIGKQDGAKNKNKIRVPALNFNILQSQQEQDEMNQEDQPLDESHQDLQDLVDAAEGLTGLDQDHNDLTGQDMQDQIPPPQQQQQSKGFTKHKLPIMNISMLDNKLPVPSQAFESSEPPNGTANQKPKENAKPQSLGMSLGFSIDLTKLKAKSGGQDDPNGNDYQLDGLPNGKPVDFQDEFMAKYDEFSESWRRMIERQKRF